MNKLIANKVEWEIRPEPNRESCKDLEHQIPGLHPEIAKLLIQRGYNSFNSVNKFFVSDLNNLDEYGEMKGCAKAANRLTEAIKSKQRILIYGDYDVDGTCSVSTCYLFLKSVEANVVTYIPDRYKEGYGVSTVGVDFAISEQFDLMITVDCGIQAVAELGRAQAAGIDVIICDHHLPGSVLPAVYAILNPQQVDCPFRGKELCGCGVALMLLRAVSEKLDQPEKWKDYLDLTAIATCCDIVPLKGINRTLVTAGLERLNATRSLGVEALLTAAGASGKLNVSDLVFQIGPRINAAGRLDHAQTAVSLLTTVEETEATKLAAAIEKLNSERRDMDKNITQEAKAKLLEADPSLTGRSTVVWSENWHKGIIGIVASRLIEFCYRPTIVLTKIDGILTGSARSVEGVHLYNALAACSTHLSRFGGHKAAAGLSLKEENLSAFIQAFENAIETETQGEPAKPTLNIDLLIDFSDWYRDSFRKFMLQIDRIRPFGPTNMPPLFATENCTATFPKRIGKGRDHLRFSVHQTHDTKRKIPVVAFNMAEHFEKMAQGKNFKIAYTIEESEWKEMKRTQLMAKDIVFYD